VVEDAAESFASRYKGQYAGTFGEIATFSFQATKTITTGEGGMVVTDDKNLFKKMTLFRSHGMLRKTYYWHELPGHNFRLTNLQAALGCAQLQHIDRIINERRRIHQQYKLQLSQRSCLEWQEFHVDVDPVLWAMAVKLDPKAFPQGRDNVMKEMRIMNIETRPGFYTARNFPYFGCKPLVISEEISRHILSLPTFPTLTNEQVEYICNCLLKLKS
jgi:perosamine synthetase